MQPSVDYKILYEQQLKITDATEVKYIRTKTEVTPGKPHPGRMALPEYLRREVIILEPDTDIKGQKN